MDNKYEQEEGGRKKGKAVRKGGKESTVPKVSQLKAVVSITQSNLQFVGEGLHNDWQAGRSSYITFIIKTKEKRKKSTEVKKGIKK